MAAIAPIVINDGQATPASHTFNPVRIDSTGVALFADRSGGIALGYPTISISLRSPNPKTGSRVYKAVKKTVLPVLEVTSPSTSSGIQPQPTKAYDLTHIEEFMLPERSTPAQRADLMAYVKNGSLNAQWTNTIANFESVY